MPGVCARAAFAVAALAVASAARAAGGHHAVDDAAIMEPGLCKVEGWLKHGDDGSQFGHAGTGCRVGPVELTLAGERQRQDGVAQTFYGVQAKWARELRPGLAVGLSVSPVWDPQGQPTYQGTGASALLTWKATGHIAAQLNVGRDFLKGAPDQDRYGVAAEWAPHPGWSFVAERYLADQTHFARIGARWFPADNWTLDVSRAQHLRGPNASNWTLGVSRVFRP